MTRLIFSLQSSVTCVRFFYMDCIDIYTPLNTKFVNTLPGTSDIGSKPELTKSDAQISDRLMIETSTLFKILAGNIKADVEKYVPPNS